MKLYEYLDHFKIIFLGLTPLQLWISFGVKRGVRGEKLIDLGIRRGALAGRLVGLLAGLVVCVGFVSVVLLAHVRRLSYS